MTLHPPIGIAAIIGRKYQMTKVQEENIIKKQQRKVGHQGLRMNESLLALRRVAYGLHTNLRWSPPEIAPITNLTSCQVA